LVHLLKIHQNLKPKEKNQQIKFRGSRDRDNMPKLSKITKFRQIIAHFQPLDVVKTSK